MYERILHPTDGSEGSTVAEAHAIDIASRYEATLHTVHAIQTNVGPEAGMVGVLDSLERAGREATAEVAERAADAGVECVDGGVETGRPHRVVLAYVDDHDVDLVVMGTHGRTGIERYLLGSVAERVVRLSPVPVLTVRASEASD